MNAGALSAHAASLSTSTERAIEVLAGLVGRTHVKEEIVHGSYRCISAILVFVLNITLVPSVILIITLSLLLLLRPRFYLFLVLPLIFLLTYIIALPPP